MGIITESDIFDALLNMTGASGRGIRLVLESADVQTALALVSQLAGQQRMEILNAISFHDHHLESKIFSAFHFGHRPNEQFLQQLRSEGLRVVKLG